MEKRHSFWWELAKIAVAAALAATVQRVVHVSFDRAAASRK